MVDERAEHLLASLWTTYSVEQIGSRYLRQLDRDSFMAVAGPLMDEHAPAIYRGGPEAQRAVCILFIRLAELTFSMPLKWQRHFRLAFDQGEIDGVAFGAAMRMIYTGNSPEPGYRGEHMKETLSNMRMATPAGIMLPTELQLWNALPDQMMIYRGALTDTSADAAKGLSWSLSRGAAAAHLCRRTLPIHAATEVRALLGLPSPPPQLVAAMVPKSAIIAVIDGSLDEVLVDRDLIQPATVQSLPSNDLLMQGVIGAVSAIQVRLMRN